MLRTDIRELLYWGLLCGAYVCMASKGLCPGNQGAFSPPPCEYSLLILWVWHFCNFPRKNVVLFWQFTVVITVQYLII